MESTHAQESDFATPLEIPEEEDVKALFLQFCASHNGEMDSSAFARFVQDCNLVNKKFTVTSADLIFQMTKAKGAAPGAGSYSSGVVHGKRVKYELFRAVTIPALAEKKGMTVEALIKKLATCGGPKLNNVTQAVPVRLHQEASPSKTNA